jgi:hypothetical protein
MLITTLLMMHGALAVFLLGAVTHQFMAVAWPRQPGPADFVASMRIMRPQIYATPIVIMYVAEFILGATIYPEYRVVSRPPLEELRILYIIGLFEMKENFAAIVLAMLPAYWYFWKKAPEAATARKMVTAILFGAVWFALLAGHMVNNARGLF